MSVPVLQGAMENNRLFQRAIVPWVSLRANTAEKARQYWHTIRLNWCKFAHNDDWWPYRGKVVCKTCGLSRPVPF